MLYVAEFQTFVLLVQTTLSLSSGSEQVLLSSRALVVNQPKGRGCGDAQTRFYIFCKFSIGMDLI